MLGTAMTIGNKTNIHHTPSIRQPLFWQCVSLIVLTPSLSTTLACAHDSTDYYYQKPLPVTSISVSVSVIVIVGYCVSVSHYYYYYSGTLLTYCRSSRVDSDVRPFSYTYGTTPPNDKYELLRIVQTTKYIYTWKKHHTRKHTHKHTYKHTHIDEYTLLLGVVWQLGGGLLKWNDVYQKYQRI